VLGLVNDCSIHIPTSRMPRRRWEDNVSHRMDLQEIGVSARNWVDSEQDSSYWTAIVHVALNHIFT
jgi:hypothetical protein